MGKITRAIAGKSKVDDEVLDNLEEALITSDVGIETTLKIIKRIEERFPALKGVMLGRGLLANPALGVEYRNGRTLDSAELCTLVQQMHDELFRLLSPRLQGNTQFLTKMKPYWEYQLPTLPKRLRKPILKATTIEKYQSAVANALRGDWE